MGSEKTYTCECRFRCHKTKDILNFLSLGTLKYVNCFWGRRLGNVDYILLENEYLYTSLLVSVVLIIIDKGLINRQEKEQTSVDSFE